MTKIIAAITLALLPTPALAKPESFADLKHYEIAFQTLNAIDAIQTCDFLARGVAYEINPILGRNPSCPKVIAFKIAGGGIHYLLVREIAKRDPEVAKWVEIFSIAVQGGVVAANLRFAF